jgi:hypothetical protein
MWAAGMINEHAPPTFKPSSRYWSATALGKEQPIHNNEPGYFGRFE